MGYFTYLYIGYIGVKWPTDPSTIWSDHFRPGTSWGCPFWKPALVAGFCKRLAESSPANFSIRRPQNLDLLQKLGKESEKVKSIWWIPWYNVKNHLKQTNPSKVCKLFEILLHQPNFQKLNKKTIKHSHWPNIHADRVPRVFLWRRFQQHTPDPQPPVYDLEILNHTCILVPAVCSRVLLEFS